jgi:DNA polymerase (family X)
MTFYYRINDIFNMNTKVAEALNKIAKIKKAKGDNQFAVGAYLKTATLISNLSKPISELDLQNTKGIGPKIAASITEFLTTGKIQFIEDNQDFLNTESKYAELLKIEGIGEKTAQQIYNELNVSTIAQLKITIANDSIKSLFKDKTIEKIKKGIEYLDTTRGRIRLDEGRALANTIETYMFPFISKITFCGSFRRSKETIGDLDFAIIPMPENCYGILVITHNRYIVENLKAEFLNLECMTRTEWLQRKIIPTDLEQFEKDSIELFRTVQNRINSQNNI